MQGRRDRDGKRSLHVGGMSPHVDSGCGGVHLCLRAGSAQRARCPFSTHPTSYLSLPFQPFARKPVSILQTVLLTCAS